MTAKIRSLDKAFPAEFNTQFKNLLVSGCSFTFNNSEKHVCAWPYTLCNLANFENVYDCSQSGAGTNHIFNSIVNEVETSTLDLADTLIIVMWSGLTRTDVIATSDITRKWHDMSNYDFDKGFSTLSLFNESHGDTVVDDLCKIYKRVVSVDAQVYESALKILALDSYLSQKGANFIFLTGWDLSDDLQYINSELVSKVKGTFTPLHILFDYARETKQIEYGHPNPEAHLGWTKKFLLPYVKSLGEE